MRKPTPTEQQKIDCAVAKLMAVGIPEKAARAEVTRLWREDQGKEA
jgi:hypothetical protein